MKKSIVTLLIIALVASCAFAGTLKGSAQIDFGYDLDTTDWGFKNASGSTYKFSFEYDTTKVEVADHTTDIWAEIAATASAKITEANAAADKANIAVSAKITKANIHVGDITFGILNAGSTLDLAKSYIDDNADGKADYDTITAVSAQAPGFTVNYKDWNGGFGAAGNIDGKTYKFYGHVETPAFKFAEDAIAVNAGAYLVYGDADSFAGASAKAAYTSDDLTASVAVDGKYDNSTVLYEVAAAAAYKFVTFDAYVTPGALMGNAAYTGDYEKTPSVNACVAAAYDIELDDVTVGLEGYVDARDVVVDAREIYVGATETCAVGEVTVVAAEDYAVFANELAASVKATHKADKFTASIKVGAYFDFDASDVVVSIPVEYSLSSTAIVENATLSLTYKGLDLIDAENNMGKITASAKIAF